MSDKEPGAYVDLNENNLMIKLPRKMIFGSFEVPRCQAKSKRSGLQCRKAAMQGKRVCRTHGGASTGPKTIAGQQRCATTKTVHG